MATPESTKPSPSKLDNRREQELYRYFQPLKSPVGVKAPRNASEGYAQITENTLAASAASSPDTTLTAFAQLCTLRLRAQRAMISVIDRERQYFIAESTKTLNLSDTGKCEKEGDGLWIGCSTVDKAGRLCEKTIEAPSENGRYAMFTITNLAADPRFNELPFVSGPPFFKFYAGTPLKTKKGINIGSVFILDDEERPPLNPDQESFLGVMAETIMKHMETASEAEEHKKVMRLSRGMNAFVEGRSHLLFENVLDGTGKRWTVADDSPLVASRKPSKSSIATQTPQPEPLSASQRLPFFSREASTSDSSQDDSDHGSQARVPTDIGHHTTLRRASNLLYDSLDIHDRGGVVFFDTTSRRHQETDESSTLHSPASSKVLKVARPAEILSSATSDMRLGSSKNSAAFTPLDEEFLHSLLHRYPRGKLWSFDADGALSSSEEDVCSPDEFKNPSRSDQSRAKRKQIEAATLRKHFTGVRQLLFYALWDAGSSRWFTAGFAWTTSSRQMFSVETELNFFMAFGNSVMAHVSRLASMAADRQKADFIGSISHELRSPLHGILASAEFLADTEQDNFQSSLVDTISSCGRTLLDTINHILDYSKINSFERVWRNGKKSSSKSKAAVRNTRIAADKEAPPMLNIYATTNVASITEEVIEGVYAGQVYQDISSTDATTFSTSARSEALDRGVHVSSGSRRSGVAKDIEILLDFVQEDYVFIAQPGALKRVIMNVFGNALKYTQKGTITVKLSFDSDQRSESEPINLEDPANEKILQIRVTDTGKGISREYLRTSLFNPFCQEDVLASGTGLGLSIVRSIVNLLRGTIDVQSEVGQGTQVTIRIPLSRIPGAGTPVATPSTTADSVEDDSMNALARDYPGNVVALHGFELKGLGIASVLRRYVEDWYGLRTLPADGSSGAADIIIVDETALLSLLQHGRVGVPLVVLCDTSTRTQMVNRQDTSTVMEFVSKPFGPHKLAKALRVCLGKANDPDRSLLPTLDSLDPAPADEITPIPEMNNLTLEISPDGKPIETQTNEVLTASLSKNAQMALDNTSSNPTSDDVTETGGDDFPFPTHIDTNDQPGLSVSDGPQGKSIDLGSRRPGLITRVTEPITKVILTPTTDQRQNATIAALADHPPPNDIAAAKVSLLERAPVSLTAGNIALLNGDSLAANATPTPSAHQRVKRPPQMLLVDDNKINLRLLETFMKKRQYRLVDTAENGQLAVQSAEVHGEGYDIIFMDISMPVMNGFEATRAIRDIEVERGGKSKNGKERAPALIIALTGLASSRDQTEAFTSGVDLFLTKPVSFKEVGKLLDNWEAHGGLRSLEGPP